MVRTALAADWLYDSVKVCNLPDLEDISFPRLLSHGTGTLLVGSTPEAALCVEVDMGGHH